MGDQIQAYDIFQTPLSSGYPLPLNVSMVIEQRTVGKTETVGQMYRAHGEQQVRL